MQLELKHLNRQLGITFLYVTHDQEEALTMSDRIALMRNGRIEQLSGPREMYEQPRTRYVADFIGETNLLAGKTAGSWIAIRPEHIRPAAVTDGPIRLDVTVTDVVFTGAVTRVHTRLASGEPLVLHWPAGGAPPAADARLTVTWDEERATRVGD